MPTKIKRFVLHVCKWVGLFHVGFLCTRRALRILCYHGFALDDEADFRPRLFIKPSTFERRMKFLAEKHFPVLPLSTALEGLSEADLPAGATVLTIDDGTHGVFERALPILRRFSFPATTYVCTYYVAKGTPVFRLALQYLFWKTKERQLRTDGLGLPLDPCVPLSTDGERESVLSTFMEFGETHLDEPERCVLTRALGERLRVDYSPLTEARIFSLMNPHEIRSAIAEGMDIQLHTHRHRLPNDPVGVAREIQDNRAVLEPLTEKLLQHLCYPSGIWSAEQWPWLADLKIASATTCIAGLNYRRTPRLGLRRILDGEHVSPIEFEAELYGFLEVLRFTRSLLRRALRVPPAR